MIGCGSAGLPDRPGKPGSSRLGRDEFVAAIPLGEQQTAQIGVIEAPAGGGGNARLGMERDAEPGSGQHGQIVGAVADRERLRRGYSGPGSERQQRVAFAGGGDDRRQHPAGDTAGDDFEPVGDHPIKAEPGGDPLGEHREPAGDQRRHRAVTAHRAQQRAGTGGRANARGRALEDRGIDAGQQRDAGFECCGKIDLAVHRLPRDRGDERTDAEQRRELIEHLVFDHRRFEIGDKEPLAPSALRLGQDIDRGAAEDAARSGGDRDRVVGVNDQIAGGFGGKPKGLGRDRQCRGDRSGAAGQRRVAGASDQGLGDQGEGDAHRQRSYRGMPARDKRYEPGLPPPVVVIAGPTASGKSALAAGLAERLDGVVINADALQCYRDLEILTARPDPAICAQVPHRLYGVLDAAERGSAGRWREQALGEIAAATAAGRLPIVVGGTGLYIRALTEGLAPFPEIPEEVRSEAVRLHRVLGGEQFRQRLAVIDPAAAGRLAAGDSQRLVRAYAVVRATGRPVAAWRAEPAAAAPYRFATILLSPPREVIYAAGNARFAAMVERGGLGEATALLRRGLDPGLPAMKAVGLPELFDHLRGEMPLAAAIAAGQRATRRYAKRQMTWFRHQLAPGLVLAEQFSESLLRCSRQFIDEFLLTGRA